MEIVLRVVIIYLFILFGLRVMGKREFGQLSPLELVTLLLVPELVSQGIVGEDFSVTGAILAVSTLFTLVYLNSLLAHRFKQVEEALEGNLAVLVHQGQMVEDIMNKERITPEEILAAMHQNGLMYLSQVEWAILQGDGKIAIVPTPNAREQYHHEEKEFIG